MKKVVRKCIKCTKILTTRHQRQYCTNTCQLSYRHMVNISMWKSNNNHKKFLTKNISGYIKRYLLEKYKEKCSLCGWNERNKTSGKLPLEVDHIDGNSENNQENNLRLLCPNCHALTPFYKNLNRGKGRKWRMDKHIKNS